MKDKLGGEETSKEGTYSLLDLSDQKNKTLHSLLVIMLGRESMANLSMMHMCILTECISNCKAQLALHGEFSKEQKPPQLRSILHMLGG